ncbi:MAG: hypothetical protein RI957_545 [Verrucomicrobiota bacterium]|jgi:hypothetical protein
MNLRCCLLLLLFPLLMQCEKGVEKEREIGYLGKARANPFLAWERFVEKQQGQQVVMQATWPKLDATKSMIIVSADQLSTRVSTDLVRKWVNDGGHAVILLDRADMNHDDWGSWFRPRELPDPLVDWAKEMGLELKVVDTERNHTKAKFRGATYDVRMNAMVTMKDQKHRSQPVISWDQGDGAVTWIVDASFMRNRWIDQKQHIDLIGDLLDWRDEGDILFLRGAGISFFSLVWQKGWMVVLGTGVLIAAWLLTHLPRFGPMQNAAPEDEIRSYDHHLEMIGDFHWRLDRGSSLLEPLRTEAQDLCHHWQLKHGRLDERLFDVMASRAGLPVDRVERAMTDPRARDQMIFTRIVADLQSIRKAFA